MDKAAPPILVYGQRAIFWGCEDNGDSLFASIAFFDRAITSKKLTLSDRNGKKHYHIETPSEFLNKKSRGRSQNIQLRIIEKL